ncbi:hypothetical protein B5M42_017595 [Paenibacillus athensensis]|uniref:DUF1648 domain-containing protein n=1 Tax=Paenibacillus athensensis TaxID=1967502 RepID=A0A4Y8Q173_9BACL|nr:hypothetical protein [Paenibacillus athensensis]MCD1260618.1 hypothetical protein [Paenibacillus athensensis]
MNRMLYVIPFVLIAINVMAIALMYDRIPESFAVHESGAKADRFAEKSIPLVFAPNAIQLVFAAVMAGVTRAIRRSTNPVYEQASDEAVKPRLRQRHMLVVQLITLIGIALFSVVQPVMLELASFPVGWTVIAAGALMVIVALIFGRGGTA